MSIFDIFKQIENEKSSVGGSVTHLVVGLGNPGDKYYLTRHNAGFLAMDYISQKAGAKVDRAKFKALVGEAEIGGKRVLLMKPQTFMNLSGEAVREAAAFYKIPAENVIVISDDVNLDVGKMRVRKSGSDGGQRGLRSIIEGFMTHIMYEIPSRNDVEEVIITKECVTDKAEPRLILKAGEIEQLTIDGLLGE